MLHLLLLVLAGVAGGFINTFAAGGSIAQLPALVGMGLHPMIANTTNHVPVLVGFMAAIWKLHREGSMPWRIGFKISLPVLLGAVPGALTASLINDRATGFVLFAALLLAFLLMIAKPDRWLRDQDGDKGVRISALVFACSVFVGFWLGLIVIGSGAFLLLILVQLANLRVDQANAIKVLTLGIATLAAVVFFAIKGEVVWAAAAPVSMGSLIGSLIAAKLMTMPNAGKWVYALVLLVLSVEIIRIGSRMIL